MKSFEEFLNENLNEMAQRDDYIPKVTRKPKEIEKLLTDVSNKAKNIKQSEEDLDREHNLNWHKTMLPIWEKWLPKGTTVMSPRDKYLTKTSHRSIYNSANGKEICSLSLDGNLWKYGEKITLDTIYKDTYINYSSSWVYLDSDDAEKIKLLGKIVEIFGTKTSGFYKEWYETASTLVDNYRIKRKSLSSFYKESSKANDLRNEYINAVFAEKFKNGMTLEFFDKDNLPTVDTNRRGRGGKDVLSVKVLKIKRTNSDVEFTYKNYWMDEPKTTTGTWSNKTLFSFWSKYTKEGQATENKFEKLSRF